VFSGVDHRSRGRRPSRGGRNTSSDGRPDGWLAQWCVLRAMTKILRVPGPHAPGGPLRSHSPQGGSRSAAVLDETEAEGAARRTGFA